MLLVFFTLIATAHETTVSQASANVMGSEEELGEVTIRELRADLNQSCQSLLEQILSNDYESLDETLPNSVATLKQRGAHRCWHKHSTFLEHLVGVHNILRLWNQSKTIGRVGLFHSAYSNSYVNLALFNPEEESERNLIKSLVGETAEDLIHLFCVIDRQSVVVNTLLRQGVIPIDGLHVPHLKKPEETVYLSASTLRMLVVFTMADIADQFFGWQDQLFGGDDMIKNSMLLPDDSIENHDSTAIWPGLSQPGLWMSYLSQLGAVARTFHPSESFGDSDLASVLPPVFNDCTEILSREDEAAARDLYWSVVTGEVREYEDIVDTLQASIAHNPWSFEPHVILAQKYLHRNNLQAGKLAASRALELQVKWGTAWDKRMSFSAWVAWTRMLHQRAQDNLNWPVSSWDVNNMGFVR